MDHGNGKSKKAGRRRCSHHFAALETEGAQAADLPACLCAVLILAGMGLFGYSYYLVDSSIPSVIYMRAESEESLALDIPAKGEILSVSEQGTSNIPQGAVTLDLSQPVTMKTGTADNLEMQVKLFGILPFKQVGIRVIEDQELIPVGVPIGIYVKTEG